MMTTEIRVPTLGESVTEATIGKWRYPPARGKLGFLDAGPFIYDYKLFPP